MPPTLVRDTISLLEQNLELLAGLAEHDYAGTVDGVRHGGVGAHVRHMLDHFEALLAGWRSGAIDYEARERDERLERTVRLAAQRMAGYIPALSDISEADLRLALRVVDDAHDAQSTLARELQFLVSHTVHHQALIKLLLAQRGIVAPESFGVAPSTRRYWMAAEAARRSAEVMACAPRAT